MHDLEFDHLHYIPDDEVNEVAWATDNVELRTVGIDIGSSTSHLMFSLVHLQRLGTALSSRFVVIKRQDDVAVADQADALPARLHHRHRRPRGVLRRLLPPRAGRSRRRRFRRRDPDRRGDQAAQRPRHRRAVLGSVGNLRLRLRRPSHGMPDGGAWLRRRRHVARQWLHRAQCRHRRRHHQARPDREGRDPRHHRDRGRRPPHRRGQKG